MMVIFVSQCEKKALNRTRRVLDTFADRIGDNTWQTVITEEGLQAVKKLLRKTASKNTAVSCHWIRSRARSDLLWVVGKRDKFNYSGVVAVNRTKRKILHNEWENNWQYVGSIQIIATIAALLHDMGKTTLGFQNKLRISSKQGDPYRHEWISLKLFSILITDCTTDEQWLMRFTQIDKWLDEKALKKTLQEVDKDSTSIAQMPPLAQWVAWLIISHHRLPPFKKAGLFNPTERKRLRSNPIQIKTDLDKYYEKYLQAFEGWVKIKTSKDKRDDIPKKQQNEFWQFNEMVMHSPVWQSSLRHWATKALKEPVLMQISQQAVANQQAISDTFLLYLSRLCLMVADHNYSSLDSDNPQRLKGHNDFNQLAANTDRKTQATKQALDEHLLGVGAFAAAFARKLPVIANSLPTIQEQQSLSKHTPNPRFKWQNKAYQLAQSQQQNSEEHGFFGVNMASTGCGKTIANARVMYGLADPKKGARFTIALGLRVLTLQTGQSFRKDLALSKEQLAILVGGQAHKALFEINANATKLEDFGSESADELIDGWLDTDIDYRDYEALNLGTVIENPKVRDLLFAPIVTCTVDHIIQASECQRGGKYMAPMLRLLSSDVILDEPDDFDSADLPALSRLVHLAGLLGSRVLLSSATLTPDLVMGLFNAYHAGRILFNRSQNKATPNVVCAWFDEQEKNINATQCNDSASFLHAHQQFIGKREKFLDKQNIRRKADILPLALSGYQGEKPELFYAELGQAIVDGAISLHNNHHQTETRSGKQVSVGLVRIANIKNIQQIIMQLFAQADIPDDTHIHLSCYHSKQLLVLRNSLENKLDRILSRDEDNPNALFEQVEIKQASQSSQAKQHIFMVLATPVAEVGRDHDYDWAIVEPSSMRSIIQLAGRVWRHRPSKVAKTTNIRILQYNIRYLTGSNDGIIFTRPGFESEQFKPSTYDVSELITSEQLNCIDAKPRIIKPKQTEINTLSGLEHQVMHDLLNNDGLNYVNAYWDSHATANRAHTHLQQISPFRDGPRQEDFLFIPNKENDSGYDVYYAQDVYENKLANATKQNNMIKPLGSHFVHSQISPWLVVSLDKALAEIQASQADKSLRALAVKYANVSLEERTEHWQFSEYLGFFEKC